MEWHSWSPLSQAFLRQAGYGSLVWNLRHHGQVAVCCQARTVAVHAVSML